MPEERICARNVTIALVELAAYAFLSVLSDFFCTQARLINDSVRGRYPVTVLWLFRFQLLQFWHPCI